MATLTVTDLTELHLKSIDELELYKVQVEAMKERCEQKKRLQAHRLMCKTLDIIDQEIRDRRNLGA